MEHSGDDHANDNAGFERTRRREMFHAFACVNGRLASPISIGAVTFFGEL